MKQVWEKLPIISPKNYCRTDFSDCSWLFKALQSFRHRSVPVALKAGLKKKKKKENLKSNEDW